MMRPQLVVMARAPRLGTVKTRLARSIGMTAALQFYRNNLADLRRRLGNDPRWQLVIAATPDRDPAPGPWPQAVPRVKQGGGGLGARITRLLAPPPVGLPPGPVVIVGSDIPDIAPDRIAAAFRELGENGFVFGPSPDGGFWLIGARRIPAIRPDLFDGVRWSGPHALDDCVARIDPRHRIGYVDTLEDIDDEEAYRRWQRRTRAST